MWILMFYLGAIALLAAQRYLLKKHLKGSSTFIKIIRRIIGIIKVIIYVELVYNTVFFILYLFVNESFSRAIGEFNSAAKETMFGMRFLIEGGGYGLFFILAVLTSILMLVPASEKRKTSHSWQVIFTVCWGLIGSAMVAVCCGIYYSLYCTLSWGEAAFVSYLIFALTGHVILGTFSKKTVESTTRKVIGRGFLVMSAIPILSLICYGLYWVWYFLGGGIAVEFAKDLSVLEIIIYGGLGLFLLFDLIVGLLYIFRR